MDDLEKKLFSGEHNLIKGKFIKDEEKANSYIKGIENLESMLKDGIMFAYKADDISVPQYVHQIEIRWPLEENRLKGNDIGRVLSCFDTVFFSRERIMNDTWLLSSEIYTEA